MAGVLYRQQRGFQPLQLTFDDTYRYQGFEHGFNSLDVGVHELSREGMCGLCSERERERARANGQLEATTIFGDVFDLPNPCDPVHLDLPCL